MFLTTLVFPFHAFFIRRRIGHPFSRECSLAGGPHCPKLAAGWEFNSKQEEVDIWTKAEGETNMCFGSTTMNCPALVCMFLRFAHCIILFLHAHL